MIEAAWRRHQLLAGAVAAMVCVALVAAAALGGDEPAHLYRTLLSRRGAHVWDNRWYAGQYLPSYSLLYNPLAKLVGNVALTVGGIFVSAVLFASVSRRQWPCAGPYPALAFALLAPSSLVTGTYPYALGLAACLAALRALQAGRTGVALGAAALTLSFSPVAFGLLCIALLAVFLAHRRVGRREVSVALGIGALFAVEAVVAILFPVDGELPLPLPAVAAAAVVGGVGAALAWRAAHGRALAVFLVLWVVANILAFLVPSPVGPTLTRLRFVLFALVLAAAALASFRPRWLAGIALAVALAYSAGSVAPRVLPAVRARSDSARFWGPAVGVLRERSGGNHRVEVVPTAAHWESYYLPRAGLALARGWHRQADRSRNAFLYERAIAPDVYRAWLRQLGIRNVVLPHLKLDTQGSQAEATLLRSGQSGLVEVARSEWWTIYELPDPTPILEGGAESGITGLDHDEISGWTGGAGTHRLAVRFTPYWVVRHGAVCLTRAADGMTLLRAAEPGAFHLSMTEAPWDLLARWWRRDEPICGPGAVTASNE
ncbi:MAG: hypothetical protein M3144_10545 [Actinomycetota bacterium]|nr:hypothetical protein [Actinomycetota bacterium]